MLGFGTGEIVVIALAVLLLFGPKKIPELARSLAQGLRVFRTATDDLKREMWSAAEEVKKPINQISEEVKTMGDAFHKDTQDPTENSETAPPRQQRGENGIEGTVSR